MSNGQAVFDEAVAQLDERDRLAGIEQAQRDAGAEREAHIAEAIASLTFDGGDIRVAGRRWGWLYHGGNGRWFACALNTEGHAYPVGSLENVAGTGWPTPEQAARAFVREWEPVPSVTEAR